MHWYLALYRTCVEYACSALNVYMNVVLHVSRILYTVVEYNCCWKINSMVDYIVSCSKHIFSESAGLTPTHSYR